VRDEIPISRVVISPDEERLVLEVLRSGHLAQGPMVERLEASFAAMCNVRHAVAVSNGTVALVAALQALQLGPGAEVVTSPFTFVATLNAALEAGARVRFCDIGLDDFNVDVDMCRAMVGDRTQVLMPVHLYGQPADCDGLLELAEQRGLALVEDAAQAHNARCGDRPVGSFGLGCFSLYGTKNVTTGEGGIITTDDDAIADRLRVLRNQGMRARYMYEVAGHNYRLTDLQAALGVAQMARLEATTIARERNATLLTQALGDVPGLVLPAVMPGRRHVFHQYTVRVTSDAALDRDTFASELAAMGVGSGVYYPRVVFDYDCYRDHPLVDVDADVPNARQAAREVLSLPVHPHLSDGDVNRVAEAVRKLLA
jgi:dTDP-4-amino-4,6-dideoxygalactose transaminase